MKRIVKIGIALFFVSLTLIPVTLAYTMDTSSDVELSIRGGLGYMFHVDNSGDTEVTATYQVVTITGKPVESGEFTIPPHFGFGTGKRIFGFRCIVATLSAGGLTESRTGFVLGIFVIFVTPPYF